MSKKILITGTAGFIGFHLVQKLIGQGYDIVGLDNINDYYDVELKYGRLGETGIDRGRIGAGELVQSERYDRYRFIKMELEDREGMTSLFEREGFDFVVHLAAQAGVRYSLVNPHAYIGSNVTGFLNILEGCRHHPVRHLIFASSSSVYGANTRMPFSTGHNVDHPVSLYAATKKSNELMAHTYASLYNVPVTGLRFFTVYGPWGRPDMSLFLFTKAILEGKPIDVFNNGEMQRDFTYVDDIIGGIERLIPKFPEPDPGWNGDDPDPATSFAPYRIFNIGNNNPVRLMDFIRTIERALGRKAELNMMPMQPGDVSATYADVSSLTEAVGFKPDTPIEEGIARFVDWYTSHYQR
jgi:UDP-glucuronate 4-epimerase